MGSNKCVFFTLLKLSITFSLTIISTILSLWLKWLRKWWALQILVGAPSRWPCRVWGCVLWPPGPAPAVIIPLSRLTRLSVPLWRPDRRHVNTGLRAHTSNHNKRQRAIVTDIWGENMGWARPQCHHVTDNQWIEFWAARNKTCFICRVDIDSVNAFIWICHLNVTILPIISEVK